MSANIMDGNFLITGGTGSFGKTMTKYLLSTNANSVTVFSRDEKKQDDMRRSFSDRRLRFVIGDVRDQNSIRSVMKGINNVFHAAALKQVPSCEFFPMEAVKTNVTGTNNVCQAALENGVTKVVCLSTDKAVYPINAMGISKAMMEKVVLSHSLSRKSKNDTVFCVTRYGNVMASRGSVIPHFINQAKQRQSLTVTNPDMTRFLMSLDESVSLVKFAFQHAQSGDICIQKAPGASIEKLAEAINQLHDNVAPIKIIGTRHGEKLDEVLMSAEEASKAIEKENHYVIPPDERDLNYHNYFSDGLVIKNKEPYTSRNTIQLSVAEIKLLLKNLMEKL